VIAQYEARHAVGSKARLCFALGKYTGAGRTEISRIGPHHIRDGEIEKQRLSGDNPTQTIAGEKVKEIR
jgi:hypothetical protein